MLAVTTNNSLKNNSIGRSRYVLGGSVVEVAVEAAGHYIVVGSSRPKSSSILTPLPTVRTLATKQMNR